MLNYIVAGRLKHPSLGYVLDNRKKVVSIVGARPNFVKLAGLYDYLKPYHHVIIHTGQHYDFELSKVFFEDLRIPEPDYYLGVGSGSQGYQLGEMIKRTEEALAREEPDLVIVYGDTNSTLAGAVASVKAGFHVAHVEAGLRSFDLSMQEEINRRIVDHLSSLLFTPTLEGFKNLVRENVVGKVYLTGDIHVDVLHRFKETARNSDILSVLGIDEKAYILATVHRAENTDNEERLEKIVDYLCKASQVLPVIIPLHPRTRNALLRMGLYYKLDMCTRIINPLGYTDFIKLLMSSRLVITDSGGVQREAFLLGIPAIVLRDRTEWVELVDIGCVSLVDVDVDKGIEELKKHLSLEQCSNEPVLGTPGVAGRIREAIDKFLNT